MKCLTNYSKLQNKLFGDICEWFTVAIATTCFDKFNMSSDETQAFIDNVKGIAESIVEDYASYEDYKDVLDEEYKFKLRVSK